MQSKYEGDMGFDFSVDADDIQEINQQDSNPSISEQSLTSENPTIDSDQNQISESSTENNSTTVSQEVTGIPIEDYFDTDYNKYDTDYTQKEQDSQSTESPSSYEDDNSSSSNTEKSSESWSGAKFLLTPITFIANIISSGLKNTASSTEQQSPTEQTTPEPSLDIDFDSIDYEKHQKNIGSTNKILVATLETVKGAVQTDIKECESYEFQYKERKKLHEKTGGTENIEMVGVNVFLDKSGKPLLPGARKSLKEHANAKKESVKKNNSEIHEPSDAISHARKEFDIAHEFGKGDDDYDQAGKVIHTGKGIVEIVALDLEPINGITSQPGFVTKSPSTAYLISKIKERSEKALKKDGATTPSTTTSENNDDSSSELSSVKKV